MPRLNEIIDVIENYAPLHLQESYDNSGLIVGDRQAEIRSALISLDCTEAVLDEAIAMNCNLIISHHPIIFSGLKSFTRKNYIERVIMKAIRNDIAIYAAHTNLDNVYAGVNGKMAAKLGLTNIQILEPKADTLKQLYVYVPVSHAEAVRNAMFEAGAGNIGEYSSCSYNLEGTGTFLPSSGANPFVGRAGELQLEHETKIEVIFTPEKEQQVLNDMLEAHPYEEVAFGIIQLQNKNRFLGAGVIGDLPAAVHEADFLQNLKMTFQSKCIRHTALSGKTISKVALCGGSGSFLLSRAIRMKADVFVTADFKYHQFFDAESQILIADIGHYESEQFTGEIFYEVLSNKFPNFALHLTAINTNPIKYY